MPAYMGQPPLFSFRLKTCRESRFIRVTQSLTSRFALFNLCRALPRRDGAYVLPPAVQRMLDLDHQHLVDIHARRVLLDVVVSSTTHAFDGIADVPVSSHDDDFRKQIPSKSRMQHTQTGIWVLHAHICDDGVVRLLRL